MGNGGSGDNDGVRVIHVVPSISEEASGPSYSVVRLCEALIAEGEEVSLAALDWAPMPSPPSFLETFPLGWGPRRLGRSPAMARLLAARAKSGAVDLIHNHSLWMMPNVYSGMVARRRDVPFVVSPRGTLSEWAIQSGSALKRVFWSLLQRPALAATTCFHATAESEYQDIRRMGYRNPVAIIPNGVDIPLLPPKNHRPSRTLLFLGRIHPVKGLDILLRAWRVVQDRFPDWNLRIAGPDSRGHLPRMRRLTRELGLVRTEFCGALMGERKWQAYRDADLFVLPTYSENFGMAVAEALAAGTPAIVTKGAPWGGLETQRAGWWIEIGVDALAACLGDALPTSPARLAEMGRAGREWMLRDYSWERIGRQLSGVYRWLLEGGEPPRPVRLY